MQKHFMFINFVKEDHSSNYRELYKSFILSSATNKQFDLKEKSLSNRSAIFFLIESKSIPDRNTRTFSVI